jgi:hypothetical protein
LKARTGTGQRETRNGDEREESTSTVKLTMAAADMFVIVPRHLSPGLAPGCRLIGTVAAADLAGTEGGAA